MHVGYLLRKLVVQGVDLHVFLLELATLPNVSTRMLPVPTLATAPVF